MEPIEFMGMDKEFLKAAPGTESAVRDLPVKRHKQLIQMGEELVNMPAVTSCWYVSDEDLEKIIKERVVWFTAWGTSHPPVILSADRPLGDDIRTIHPTGNIG